MSNLDKIIPGLLKDIDFEKVITPIILEKYTLSHKGAIQGWASTVSSNNSELIPQGGILPNLFQVGHWSNLETGSGGITMVAASGRRVSKLILRKWTEIP